MTLRTCLLALFTLQEDKRKKGNPTLSQNYIDVWQTVTTNCQISTTRNFPGSANVFIELKHPNAISYLISHPRFKKMKTCPQSKIWDPKQTPTHFVKTQKTFFRRLHN